MYGARKASRVNKPEAGHLAKAGVVAGEMLQEFRVTAEVAGQYQPGSTLPISLFAVGQKVDVQGTSIGKGFAGTIKRHHFSSQRASHGNSRSHNVPGSISMAQDPGRVFPARRCRATWATKRDDAEPRRRAHRRGAPIAADTRRGAGRKERLRHGAPGGEGACHQGSPVMQLELLDEQGQATSKVDAPDTVFARDYNEALIHQIVVAFRPTRAKGRARRKVAPRSSIRPRSRGARRAPAVRAPV